MKNELLKFITCGSVDDGKSTLIGHMLYDAKLIFADQKRALELDSKVGSREGKIDYSLLLDGLMAEREQGITIDVAYRYFSTERRSFIVADTPGHEEYTRNMAVGASFASLAVILTDASQGVLQQTRRHARICSLMGIRHFVFAVNKMDLVNYDRKRFKKIEKEIKVLMAEFDYGTLRIIPVSATEGDNITRKSEKMMWYSEDTLLHYLEEVDVGAKEGRHGFSMPVQRVCRPNHNFRGFQGQISSGEIAVGEEITVMPSREKAKVIGILQGDQPVEQSSCGQAVTIQLDTEIDVSRGCVLERDYKLSAANMFAASILWMDDNSLIAGRNFWLKTGTQLISATVMKIKYKIDVNTGAEVYTDAIYKNEIAFCEISTGSNIVFDCFENNRELGSLILIDRITNMTSACGTIVYSLERGENLTWHNMDITREMREGRLGQKAITIWMTGLSGAGKSTLANALEKRLFAMGRHTMLLDGDNVRMGLNKNLGFTEQDRIENLRRIAEVSKLMNDAGLIVLTSFISPYRLERRNAKEIIGDSFVEVYVSTPLEECERRDVKGLYQDARLGKIANFTGISGRYEEPENPDIVVDTSKHSLEECLDILLEGLEKYL
ncbi:MAG: adenylyl-sulfate kinase [Lachnospiraceae bacterium]|jgi:bifunctional enzyme CysN/CysC|nr:adenylyl-sulfate kinase [Lachnospiraceae bacterium]MCI8872639.1 adenylyl-sulfate kinase [Lachnospiraceae bacterium]GFI32179.1 bifunctional enzyme CysN/CysC [Lachnospiraceae bacterium]